MRCISLTSKKGLFNILRPSYQFIANLERRNSRLNNNLDLLAIVVCHEPKVSIPHHPMTTNSTKKKGGEGCLLVSLFGRTLKPQPSYSSTEVSCNKQNTTRPTNSISILTIITTIIIIQTPKNHYHHHHKGTNSTYPTPPHPSQKPPTPSVAHQ